MSNDELLLCPSCGSRLAAGAAHCDICGDDLSTPLPEERISPEERPAAEERTRPEARPAASTKAPPATGTSGAATPAPRAGAYCVMCGAANDDSHLYCHACGQPLKKRQGAGKGKPQQQSKRATAPQAMFSTWQWIVIAVASFILGGALTATFFPASGPGTAATGGESGPAAAQQQAPKVSLEQVNAARDAAQANPQDMQAQLRYANILHDAMMLDQAIAQYKLYLASEPDNPDARVDLGICYFEQKKFDEAIAEMERAVAGAPDHQLGNFNLGIVNANAGNKEKAMEWFRKARDIDPNSTYGRNAAAILTEMMAGGAQQ